MRKEQDNLNRFKGQNPFSVPDGYMETLTDRIMSQLPEKEEAPVKHISMLDRVRPWIYMAAMFVGLGLFFKVFLAPPAGEAEGDLLVKNEMVSYSALTAQQEEDMEYLEYLESRYLDTLLAEQYEDME
ncbi:MAG: hypothetical protein LUD74_08780 [Tannerellaceae bacterium]|nr:hypothetical protein [Tannerellaceae bacterium]